MRKSLVAAPCGPLHRVPGLVAGAACLATVVAGGCKVGPDPKPLEAKDLGAPLPASFTPPELTAAEIAGDPTARTVARASETATATATADAGSAPAANGSAAADARVATADASAEDLEWWKRFGDPVLDALVAKADSGNATIAELLGRVRVAQARLGISESELWPSISAAAEYRRVKQNFSQLAAEGVDTEPYDVWAYGLAAYAWELDLWGRIARLIESSEADLRGSVDELRGAIVSVRAQVATAYVEVRTIEARLAALESSIANLAQALALAEQKYDAGTVTLLDVNEAQTNLDVQSARVPGLRSTLAQAVARLAPLCGTTVAETSAILGARRPIPVGPLAVDVGIPADLLARRPDLRSANERYRAAVAMIGANEALNYPSLAIDGNVYISATKFSGLGDVSNNAYSFGPSLSVPLFTGWRITSQVLAAKAMTESAYGAWRGAVLRAFAEVEASVSAIVLARDADARYSKAVASASDTYRLARLQYEAGTTTLENLLDVQNQLLSAEDGEPQARGLAAQSVIELYRALGGGWQTVAPDAGDDARRGAREAVAASPAADAPRSPVAGVEAKPDDGDSR